MGRAARLVLLAAATLAAAAASGAAAAPPALRLTSPAAGLALSGGDLWVSVAADGVLLRLDARDGRRLARIDVHRRDARALGGGALAPFGGAVFVAAPVHVDDDPVVGDASGWVARVDRAGSFRLRQVHGDPPSSLAVAASGLWVAGGGTLRRFDPASLRQTKALRLGGFLGGVGARGGAVWVTKPLAGLLLRVDARTARQVASIRVGRSSGGGAVAVGALVWTATDAGVVGVDPRTNRIVRRAAVPRPLALAADGARVWVSARDGLYSIDGSGRVARRARASGGLVAARAGTVWASDGASNSVRRLASG